ncbi:hypothetical protein MAP00_002219 [Monascus purpureus]|nr:hypothetical protein MAP00_002219 [Monascus purpureus]
MASSSSFDCRKANLSEESQESSVTSGVSSGVLSGSAQSIIDATVRGRLGFPAPLPPLRPATDEENETSVPLDIQKEILSTVGRLMQHHGLTYRYTLFIS